MSWNQSNIPTRPWQRNRPDRREAYWANYMGMSRYARSARLHAYRGNADKAYKYARLAGTIAIRVMRDNPRAAEFIQKNTKGKANG